MKLRGLPTRTRAFPLSASPGRISRAPSAMWLRPRLPLTFGFDKTAKGLKRAPRGLSPRQVVGTWNAQ
eukprot:7179529-Pyramimonas_sp.AAC.1